MTDERVPTQGMLIHSCRDWPCVLCRPHAWAGIGDTLLCMECATNLVADSIEKVRRSMDSDEDLQAGVAGSGGLLGRTKRWFPPDRGDR
jgi:hypothetical protein